MDKKLIIIFSTGLILFTILYVRIAQLTLDTSLSTAGTIQSTKTVPITQTRGLIYDCRLTPLVDTTTTTFPISQTESIQILKRYSTQQPAQHIIGYYDKSKNEGVCGIERQYNDFLTSTSETTTISYTLDALRRPLQGVAPQISYATPTTSGIVLTIDSKLQKIVEQVGYKSIKKGAIVLTEISTGKIRAAASFPLYNANTLTSAIKNPDSPLVNRIYTAYSVGSVFKLVTAATALEANISPTYTCTGEIELNGIKFGCHNKNGHGTVDMQTAIAVSCNPYFINLSTLIDKTAFLNMANDLSFGKQYYTGNLPTQHDLNNIGDFANLSFGQGALTATPIQIAELISAIANNGNAIRTTTVEGTTTDGKTITPQQTYYPTHAISKSTATRLKNMMISAVMDTPRQNAKPETTTAGGKTATAQTGQFREGEEILHAWFAGFFPADKPKYTIAIIVEDAKSGNESASPIFKTLAEAISAPILK